MPSGRVLTVPLQGLNTRSQGERKAINKLPEKIILICPRSAERNRDGGRERGRECVCVGATASCCCWSSRSPFDVMQSALTKCQRQAKEPKPKASPDLTACLPCAFKISLATGLGLIVCVLFMLPFSFLFPLFHFDFFFCGHFEKSPLSG